MFSIISVKNKKKISRMIICVSFIGIFYYLFSYKYFMNYIYTHMDDNIYKIYKDEYNKSIEEINDKRIYINKHESKKDLINHFEKNNNNDTLTLKNTYNENVIKNKHNCLRIMTYNVHFGTNHKTEQNLDNIIRLITEINPDILCLNEVTTNKTEFNENGFPNTIGNLINFSFCSITPSWFLSPYGTCVYINVELINHAYLTNYPRCIYPTKKSCALQQKISTFKSNDDDTDVETRCFIKFSLKDFDIICVHLEPYSKDIRIEQLNEINNNIKRKTIIMGDFNIFNEDDFANTNTKLNKNKQEMKKIITSSEYKPVQTTDEMRLIKNVFKWVDSFEITNMVPISYSNWTGIRVDYIFFTQEWMPKDVLFSRTYFSNESDHIPIICDILSNFYFDTVYDIDYFDNDLRKPHIDDKLHPIEKLSYENTINEKPMMINHKKFLYYYKLSVNNVKNKKMNMGGQISDINDINDIFFYNGQTSNNITWFKKQQILEPNENYEFKDPTMSSNEPKQINLGGFGLYATDSLDFAINYAVQFTMKEVNKNSHPIIFVFKLNLDTNDINNLKIGMVNYRLIMRNYNEIFDENYHIMFLNDRQFQHNSIQIKFTNLFFNDFKEKIELVKVFNFGNKYDNIYYENPKQYELPTQKIFDFTHMYLVYKYLSNKYKLHDDERIREIIATDIDNTTIQKKINEYINYHHENTLKGGGNIYYYKYLKYLQKKYNA